MEPKTDLATKVFNGNIKDRDGLHSELRVMAHNNPICLNQSMWLTDESLGFATAHAVRQWVLRILGPTFAIVGGGWYLIEGAKRTSSVERRM